MSKPSKNSEATIAAKATSRAARAVAPETAPLPFRKGTKGSLIVEKLSTPAGVSIEELMSATGWLAHTTRAALTGLRKRGYAILREPNESDSSRYRIETESAQGEPKRRKGARSGKEAKAPSPPA